MSNSVVIRPTIGRVVWYWPSGRHTQPQPFSAQVAYVHEGGTMVNLGYLDHNGNAGSAASVPLKQAGEPDPAGKFCEWMPYQQGQAAKTEAAEAGAASRAPGWGG